MSSTADISLTNATHRNVREIQPSNRSATYVFSLEQNELRLSAYELRPCTYNRLHDMITIHLQAALDKSLAKCPDLHVAEMPRSGVKHRVLARGRSIDGARLLTGILLTALNIDRELDIHSTPRVEWPDAFHHLDT
jgi:hypothetical protein